MILIVVIAIYAYIKYTKLLNTPFFDFFILLLIIFTIKKIRINYLKNR